MRRVAAGQYPVRAEVDAFKGPLVVRLRSRGLWSAPLAYLDYPELESWARPEDLTVLALDCVEYAVVRRARSLAAKLELYGNVDPLVLSNVGHFLTARQKRADPVGYAVYANVIAAARLLHGAGRVEIDGDRVDTKCLVRAPNASGAAVLIAGTLRDRLAAGADYHALIDGLSRISKTVQTLLAEAITVALGADDGAWRVRDLISATRDEVRAAWRAKSEANGEPWGVELDGRGGVVRVPIAVMPEPKNGDLAQLVARVEAGIDSMVGQKRKQDGVRKIFREMVDALETACAEELPSQAEIARRLGWPKSTVADRFSVLRSIIEVANSDAPLESALSESGTEPSRKGGGV